MTSNNYIPKVICFSMILDTQLPEAVFQLFQTLHLMASFIIEDTLSKSLFKKVLLLKYAISCFMAKNQTKNNLIYSIIKLKIKCIFIKRSLTFIKAFNMMLIQWVLCAVLLELFQDSWILKKTLRIQNIENNVQLNLLQRCLF